MTDEEKAAADKAEADRKASEAAAELAARRHAADEERERSAAPCRMVDLHNVRQEFRAELDELRTAARAEPVRHAVPTLPAPAAQPEPRSGLLWKVLGGLLVVGVLVAAAVAAARKGSDE